MLISSGQDSIPLLPQYRHLAFKLWLSISATLATPGPPIHCPLTSSSLWARERPCNQIEVHKHVCVFRHCRLVRNQHCQRLICKLNSPELQPGLSSFTPPIYELLSSTSSWSWITSDHTVSMVTYALWQFWLRERARLCINVAGINKSYWLA